MTATRTKTKAAPKRRPAAKRPTVEQAEQVEAAVTKAKASPRRTAIDLHVQRRDLAAALRAAGTEADPDTDLAVLLVQAEQLLTPEAADNVIDRLELAKLEDAAWKAWARAGSKGDAPATPNLDAIREQAQAGRPRRRRGASASSTNSTRLAIPDDQLVVVVRDYLAETPTGTRGALLRQLRAEGRGVNGNRLNRAWAAATEGVRS